MALFQNKGNRTRVYPKGKAGEVYQIQVGRCHGLDRETKRCSVMRVKTNSKDGFKITDLNRRKACHEKCKDCSGWILSEIQNCTFFDCPFYPYRTGEGKQNPKDRKKAIRKYCLWCMNKQPSEVTKCPSKTCPLFAYRLFGTDRSIEIDSEAEKHHIEHVFQDKNRLPYPLHGEQKENPKIERIG